MDADSRRSEGARTYEAALGQLGRRADGLDEYWRRFRRSCAAERVTGSFTREWFAVLVPSSMPGAVAPGCGPAFSEIRQIAEEIKAEVQAVEEAARRADVYPGPRRELRRKYRLDDPF